MAQLSGLLVVWTAWASCSCMSAMSISHFVFVCVFIACKPNVPCAYIWTNLCCNSISIYNLMCSVTQSHMRFLVLSANLRAFGLSLYPTGIKFYCFSLCICTRDSLTILAQLGTGSLRSTVYAIVLFVMRETH